MWRSMRARRLAWVAALALLLAGCVGPDDTELEPLRGMRGEPAPSESAAAADGEEVLADAVELDDLPEDMYADAPARFGEVPLDELDLPPDVPPPPVEPVTPLPPVVPSPDDAPPATAPAPPEPPPASVPTGPLDPVAVGSIDDYCTLFREHPRILATVDSVMVSGPPERVPEVLALADAVFRRAVELDGGGLRGHHEAIAGAMRAYRSLLADHGNRLDRVLTSDAGLAALAAIGNDELNRSVEVVADHVTSACGTSLH